MILVFGLPLYVVGKPAANKFGLAAICNNLNRTELLLVICDLMVNNFNKLYTHSSICYVARIGSKSTAKSIQSERSKWHTNLKRLDVDFDTKKKR